MPLHTDYRPSKLKEFIGNKETVQGVKTILKREKDIPATFLIIGPAGTGKTTLARIIKNEIGCHDADFTELDAADDRGIDAMRVIKEDSKFAPLMGKKKMYLLDEAHMITPAAQESLLKMLEKPPKNVHFCICTTDPQKLKVTIKRRAHIYELKPLSDKEIEGLLHDILKKEKKKKFSEELLDDIIDLSNGSAGMALKLLDQVIDIEDEKSAMSVLKSSGVTSHEVIEICRTLMDYKMNKVTKWGKIRVMLKDLSDPEGARYAILGYLNSILLNTSKMEDAIQLSNLIEYFRESMMFSGKAALAQSCVYAIDGQ